MAETTTRNGAPDPSGSPAPHREPPLALEGATHTYRDGRRRPGRTIGPVSCTIGHAQWIALIGPNGSGKSTILHLMSGASSPSSGTVRWFGGIATTEARLRIGVVFQSPALDELLTIREALTTAAAVQKMPARHTRARIDPLADELGFAARLDERIGTLSGGLVRRVDLARAVLHQPDLVILDEPTAGLDEESRRTFNRLLDHLRADGVTIVASTHMIDEVRRADRVVLMRDGRVAMDTGVRDLPELLGGAKVRVDHPDGEALALLGAHGLEATADGAVLDLDARPPDEMGRLIRDLAARGAHVTAGPPTLRDLFGYEPPDEEDAS